MGASLLSEHPNDEALLAYLDGELSRTRTRSIRNHLKICWKCRFVLADLESQAQTISRLLSPKLDSDIHQSVKAKDKFLRWRASFERQQGSFFGKRRSFLPGDGLRVALAQ
jgi:anti-sigma factor RsiW